MSRSTTPHSPHKSGQPTWDVALLFPAQGDWTEEEYLSLGTNRMIELSDGFLEVLPMPTVFHQLVVKFLFTRLDRFVTAQAAGTVLFAPLPVKLGPGKFREPDIVFLRRGRMKDARGQPEGADLVMEVVSEGEENRERDLVTKRNEYARAGISEYWVVDPERQQVTVLALDGASYRVHGEFGIGQRATSLLLPGFELAVDEVFEAGRI